LRVSDGAALAGASRVGKALAKLFAPSPCGGSRLVVYLDLLLAEVLLDYLLVLHNILADAHLFLDHRPLLDHHLFLEHGHRYLVFPDLRLGGRLLDRDALHRDLFALLGHSYLLAIGADPFSDPQAAGFPLANSGPELLLRALDPQLVLVRKIAPRLGEPFLLSRLLAEPSTLRIPRGYVGALLVLTTLSFPLRTDALVPAA